MTTVSLNELIPVLQVAIGPVILISGVGLLLLTMTNRLGRAVDRARQLAGELRRTADSDRQLITAQISRLVRRAALIRLAIALAGVSALLAAVLIITLFLGVIMQAEVGLLIVLIFTGCMTTLIGSLFAFVVDIYWSLAALRTELERETQQ